MDHAMKGVSGGFMQANHGKKAPLKRMKINDWIIIYSPKQSMQSEIKCQEFSAIAQILDEKIYQIKMPEDFIPFRRNVKYCDCEKTSVLPLISQLNFIENKNKWGFQFKFGFFEIKKPILI